MNTKRLKGVVNAAMQDSPVEQVRKTLPRGDGLWPGFAYVYGEIAKACENMARAKYVYLMNTLQPWQSSAVDMKRQ